MPGLVTASIGDRLWTGKQPWHRARHPGLLSLRHPSLDRLNEDPAKAGGVNRHITSPYLWSCSVGWCLAEGLVNGDQRQHAGSGAHYRRARDDALY